MGRRIASLAIVSLLVLGIPGLDAQVAQAAEPTPHTVWVTGTLGLQGYDGSMWTEGLTVRPWYLLGIPLRFGTVSGKIKAVSYKRDSTYSCLFGLAWNIRVLDTPARSVQFDCAFWIEGRYYSTPEGSPEIPMLGVLTLTATEGGPGVGVLGFSYPGGTPPEPDPHANIQVIF